MSTTPTTDSRKRARDAYNSTPVNSGEAAAAAAAVLASRDEHIVARLDGPTDAERRDLWTAYTHFIALHRFVKDDSLSPPPALDAVWHRHLLYTRHYDVFCTVHVGRFVHHDAARADEPDLQPARRARYETARALCEAVHGTDSPFLQYWPTTDVLFCSPPAVSVETRAEDAPKITLKFKSLDPYKITVKTMTGKTYQLDVSFVSTVKAVKDILHTMDGVPPDQVRLIFGSKHLEDNLKIGEYGIEAGATLHSVVKLRGC